jgi:hypothetical protein
VGYLVYGARSRPDAYPHEIYRCEYPKKASGPVVVEQYAHGQWMRVYSDGDPVHIDWIDEQLEKGLLWKLENGTRPWDDPAVTPPYLTKLNCRALLFPNQVECLARGRHAEALSSHHITVVSRSTFEQKSIWFVAQQSHLDEDGGVIHTTKPDTAYFTNEKAAMKHYKQWAKDLRNTGTQERVVLSLPAPTGAVHTNSWWERLENAASNHLAGVEQERKAEAERKEREERDRLGGLVERLRELTARPTGDLSSAEFREKMRLKREVGSHGC